MPDRNGSAALILCASSRCCAGITCNRSGSSTAPSGRRWQRRLPAFRNGSGWDSARKAPSSPMTALARSIFTNHPIDWLRALMAAMKVPLSSTEPNLQVPIALLGAVGERFAQFARPWIAIGIGASHPDKDWSDATWSEFLRALRAPGTVFLVGGPANEARAEKFISVSSSGQIVNACGLRLIEAAALLRLADLFIGPSSGPLNLAAAGRTEAFGLFGSTPVLAYSRFIRAIVPKGGPSPGGMARISPAQVLERIAPHLSRRKAPA